MPGDSGAVLADATAAAPFERPEYRRDPSLPLPDVSRADIAVEATCQSRPQHGHRNPARTLRTGVVREDGDFTPSRAPQSEERRGDKDGGAGNCVAVDHRIAQQFGAARTDGAPQSGSRSNRPPDPAGHPRGHAQGGFVVFLSLFAPAHPTGLRRMFDLQPGDPITEPEKTDSKKGQGNRAVRR